MTGDIIPSVFVHIDEALAVPCSRTKQRIVGSFRLRGAAIYALVDARDSRVRYVGKTTSELLYRLDWHLRAPTNAAMRTWLSDAGKKHARIVLLEYVQRDEWEDAERGWVHWFLDRGQLLNVDPGGKFRDRKGKPLGVQMGTFAPPTAPVDLPKNYGNDTWGRLYKPMRPPKRK